MNMYRNLANLLILVILGTQVPLMAGGPPSGTRPGRTLNRISANGQGIDANHHDSRKIGIHDGNKILTRFHNFGAIADWRVPGRYDCGIYPIGSGHSYLAEFSPIVAAEVRDTQNQVRYIVSDALVSTTPFDAPSTNDYLWEFEPLVGYANPNDSLIAMSDDSISWPQTWPNRPSSWDGLWNGQYGAYSRADQESYFLIDDYNNDEFQFYPFLRDSLAHSALIQASSYSDSSDYAYLHDASGGLLDLVLDVNAAAEADSRLGRRPDMIQVDGDKAYQADSLYDDHNLRLRTYSGNANDSPAGTSYSVYNGIRRGLGVEVDVRGYQWAHPAAEDILIFTYWINNRSDQDYEKFVFGMYGDADVGDDGDQHDDDAWFDTVNDIVYQWDHDLWSVVKGGFKPAYFGWKYLESPGNPLNGLDDDEDGMIDESQFDGLDNDGDWNPLVDDIGADGIGSNFGEYQGPDADGTEGNGIPDPGEPNFEYTDNDESDQIGLTSFTAARWPGIFLPDDAVTWGQLTPGNFTDIAQTVDITFMYGSAYFKLPVHEERKFAVAIVFGEDYEDILRNSQTMQQIYNSDYNFAKPPNKPHLTAVPGDGKVTLYWDDLAEYSRDPIYGLDFEGYRIYRATDPAFNEVWTITDTYGNPTLNKPIAQFDIVDGLTGPHPHGINGIHLDMGTDTGLRHSWTDTTVENGQTYYYAITAYDFGYDVDFYDRGIAQIPDLQIITPSECNKKIEINASGDAVAFDINTVRVVPNAPAMGYVAAEMTANLETGLGTGEMEIELIDPAAILDGTEYEITFRDWSNDVVDNDGDWSTWTDDSTIVDMSSTLQLLIPPNSDTLHVQISTAHVTNGITENTARFYHAGYWFLTSAVDSQHVAVGDSTVVQWFVDIPDTSFYLDPTLGLWDGWEPLHEDLGTDGCNDAYEDGMGGCSETALNLGGDPNHDNWHPVFNPEGTQANARPDAGEPLIDMLDIDEITRETSWYKLVNLNTGEVLLDHQDDLSGEARGLVREGIRLNFTNDEIAFRPLESGWTRAGINMDVIFSLTGIGSFDYVPTPFDFLLTVYDEVTDTSFNGKPAVFDLYDLTNDKPVDFVYMPTENDTILRQGARVFPLLEAGGQRRVSWRYYFESKAAEVNDITEWNDLVICASSQRGIALYDGENWSTMDSDQGLLGDDARAFAFDASGRLLVGMANGLCVYTQTGWVPFSVDLTVGSGTSENEKVNYLAFEELLVAQDGTLWSTSNKGILHWPDWTRTRTAELWSEDGITTIDWFSGDWTLNASQGPAIAQSEVTSLVEMENGTIVVGSKSHGLFFWNPDTAAWRIFDEDRGLPNEDILSLATTGENLYIGTKRGFTIMHVPDSTILFHNKDDLTDRRVNAIELGSDGSIHLGTAGGYTVLEIAGGDTTIQQYELEDIPELATDHLQAIRELSDGSLWIGTEVSVAAKSDGVWEDWAPEAGDQCIIKTAKPFSALDTLRFTVSGASTDAAISSDEMDKIAVVPNPYVVTASWEPEHLYESGRGIRKIDFIHLPPRCTIRIYTLSGKFVDSIEHDDVAWNGAESWNLLSRDGLEIAYGLYVFHVEAPGIGNHIGKFAVIK